MITFFGMRDGQHKIIAIVVGRLGCFAQAVGVGAKAQVSTTGGTLCSTTTMKPCTSPSVTALTSGGLSKAPRIKPYKGANATNGKQVTAYVKTLK